LSSSHRVAARPSLQCPAPCRYKFHAKPLAVAPKASQEAWSPRARQGEVVEAVRISRGVAPRMAVEDHTDNIGWIEGVACHRHGSGLPSIAAGQDSLSLTRCLGGALPTGSRVSLS